MKVDYQTLAPEEREAQRKKAICSICGRPTRGLWRETKGQRVRLPTRHKSSDGEYCVGSYRTAVIAD